MVLRVAECDSVKAETLENQKALFHVAALLLTGDWQKGLISVTISIDGNIEAKLIGILSPLSSVPVSPERGLGDSFFVLWVHLCKCSQV